jgi:hypothetical protein
VVVVVAVVEGDVVCLSVADKFIASGSVFGNM